MMMFVFVLMRHNDGTGVIGEGALGVFELDGAVVDLMTAKQIIDSA